MPEKQTNRSFERLPILLPVEFRGSEGVVQAKTLNVSRGGMFVQTTSPLPDGARAFFRFHADTRPLQFHLEGEVVWSRKRRGRRKSRPPSGMGIRFLQHRAQNDTTLENIFSVLHGMSR